MITEIAFAQKNPTVYPYGGSVIEYRLRFNSLADFENAVFKNRIDFREARFDKSGLVEFSLTTIRDTVLIGNMGSADIQNYDFLRAKLLPADKQVTAADTAKKIPEKLIRYPGAKILITGPVNLKIQLEKFKFITIFDTLDYYAKKDIISTLKDISFDGDRFKNERFELDYLFAKSTLYQKESVNFEEYSALHP
ncbi:hypothetical protein IIA28_11550, partial [candidate division KSB1 bacterium]|nr:hypothetical protein [candidate division KSB1 bacterium]